MANNNNFNFDIPGIIIFLAYVFCWPVGVVLTILRAISKASQKASRNEKKYNYNYNYNYNYGSQTVNNSGTQNAAKQEQSQPQKKRKTSKAVVWCVAGAILCFILAAFMFLGMLATFSTEAFIIAAFLLVSGFGLIIGADAAKKQDTRLARIRAIIGNKKSINLSKLAAASKESIKKIRRDVQRLIDKGEFGDEAYIDLGTNNFMRNPDAEPDNPEMFDYKTVYGDLFKKDKKEKKEKSEKNAQSEADNKKKAEENSEKNSDKDNFESIISEIRRLNDEIKDAPVSERIYKIEAHTKNIFDYVTDHPEAMPQIRTFMNYYLPTTLKLLESYSRIERVGVAGENMKKSKNNIEKTLDLLVIGFEQQVDLLFKNEFIDISSDISVLEQMMQKDGLDGRNDFDISSYVDKVDKKDAAEKSAEKVDPGFTDEISDRFGGAAAQSAPDEK